MHQTDKNTMTGRVIREYECRKCGHSDWADEGVALWKVMHDAREEDKAEAAARAAKAEAAPPEVAQAGRKAPGSLWQRCIGFLRKI